MCIQQRCLTKFAQFARCSKSHTPRSLCKYSSVTTHSKASAFPKTWEPQAMPSDVYETTARVQVQHYLIVYLVSPTSAVASGD